MKFEWDRTKATANQAKHAVPFEEAVSVFYDPLAATFPDPDHSVGERRLITYGHSQHGRLLVLSHTESEDTIRVISARVATAREKKRYETQRPEPSR
jgi:uncharacterized DUF497 family protein